MYVYVCMYVYMYTYLPKLEKFLILDCLKGLPSGFWPSSRLSGPILNLEERLP